ncbi:MAG: hypothetical protein WA766_11655 [Candidatus Acidiferrales bacterium]
MLTPTQYSDFHRLIWICSIIGSVGTAGAIAFGIMRWMSAIWHKATNAIISLDRIKDIGVQTNETAKGIADVKLAVDVMQTNHLTHLSSSMEKLVESNEQLVGISKDMRDGIIKLVDRSREA